MLGTSAKCPFLPLRSPYSTLSQAPKALLWHVKALLLLALGRLLAPELFCMIEQNLELTARTQRNSVRPFCARLLYDWLGDGRKVNR